jgi:hypothetical protein
MALCVHDCGPLKIQLPGALLHALGSDGLVVVREGILAAQHFSRNASIFRASQDVGRTRGRGAFHVAEIRYTCQGNTFLGNPTRSEEIALCRLLQTLLVLIVMQSYRNNALRWLV